MSVLKPSLFGYSKASVAELEAKKNKELDSLRERLLQHQAQEAEVVSLVLEAKRTAREIVVQAQREAEELLRVARQEAQGLLQNSQEYAERELVELRREVESLQRLRAELVDTEEAFKRELQVDLYRCIDAINKATPKKSPNKTKIVLPGPSPLG